MTDAYDSEAQFTPIWFSPTDWLTHGYLDQPAPVASCLPTLDKMLGGDGFQPGVWCVMAEPGAGILCGVEQLQRRIRISRNASPSVLVEDSERIQLPMRAREEIQVVGRAEHGQESSRDVRRQQIGDFGIGRYDGACDHDA